jgi:hypothetical protein
MSVPKFTTRSRCAIMSLYAPSIPYLLFLAFQFCFKTIDVIKFQCLINTFFLLPTIYSSLESDIELWRDYFILDTAMTYTK